MIWVGPTNQHDLELQFLEFFAQTCELSGDVFFQADPAEVHKWVKNRVSKRKAALPHGFSSMPMSEYLHCLVSCGHIMRKEVIDQMRVEKGGLTGAFLADLEQTAGAGSNPGITAPPLNTHSLVWSYESDRIGVKKEYFAMQGLDTYPQLSGGRGLSPMLSAIDIVDEEEGRFLAGNGIHIGVFGTWFLYVMGNIRRKPIDGPSKPLLVSSGCDSGDDFDESQQP